MLSPYIIAVLSALITAQTLKYVLQVIKLKKLTNIKFLYQSGSMPSVHTAVTTSLIVVIGYLDGINSNVFAIILVVGIVVAYDAMQVRRAAGEQGIAITELLTRAKIAKIPYNALGHRPLEVISGVIVGLIVGLIVVIFAA